jgi:Flp pilus assembly protein TadD
MKNAFLITLFSLFTLLFSGCDSRQGREAPKGGGVPSQLFNYEKEAGLLRSILKEDPVNLNALIRLGNLSMDANRFPEAIEAYGKALEIDPKNANVRVDMGICYRRSGRPVRAVEEFRRAITYSPRHLNAHMNLGVVLAYDLGKREEAVKEFEKALDINPTSPNAPAIRQEVERLKAGG